MRNHDEKKKDMQRSVLPSTSRKTAREERRQIHKRARARERDLLTEYRKDPEAAEPDFRENRRVAATSNMVWDRRAYDKIGPLTRWAVRTVEETPALRAAPLHEQVAHFEAILPGDLIGKHAVAHIRWALEAEFGRVEPLWMTRMREGRGPGREERRQQVLADARAILEAGRHGRLNAALRRVYYPSAIVAPDGDARRLPPVRFLLGVHDVEEFAQDVAGYQSVCEVVRAVAAES
mgnify:CR=1 FL=1